MVIDGTMKHGSELSYISRNVAKSIGSSTGFWKFKEFNVVFRSKRGGNHVVGGPVVEKSKCVDNRIVERELYR